MQIWYLKESSFHINAKLVKEQLKLIKQDHIIFADFSVNSQQMFMKFCKHYFSKESQQMRKFCNLYSSF